MIDFTILVISYNCVSECVPLLSYCYIWRSWVCASKTYFQMQPTRCNVTQFIYFCETLYMFQAVPLPIIRSSNCTYNFRYFVKPLLLPGTVVAGSSKGLKKYPMLYIQFLSSWWWAEEPPEICRTLHRNKLFNVASHWWYLKLTILYRPTPSTDVCGDMDQ